MHSPAARALLQPCALLHHPRDILKDLTLAGHVVTITYNGGHVFFNYVLDPRVYQRMSSIIAGLWTPSSTTGSNRERVNPGSMS